MFHNGIKKVLMVLILMSRVDTGCSQEIGEQILEARKAVELREIAFAKTMADRDLDSFKVFISPEAVFFNGNEPIKGREAILRAWTPFFKDEIAPFSWHPDLIEILDSGGLAISSGPVKNAGGELLGRFNSIWRQDPDGQWRVVFDKGE